MLVPAPTLDNHRRRNIVGAEQGGFIGCLFGTSCFELSRDIHTPPVWEDKTVQGEIGEYRQPLLSFDCHDLKSPPCLNSWLGRGLRKCGEEGEMRGSPRRRDSDHITTHTLSHTGPALGRCCDDEVYGRAGFPSFHGAPRAELCALKIGSHLDRRARGRFG